MAYYYFNHMKLLLGVLHLAAESKAERCLYSYTIQPGPTTESCDLRQATYFELKCQVSSDGRHNFTIGWHYSPLSPGKSYISSTTNSIDELMLENEIKNTVSNTTTTSLLSIMIPNEVSFWEDGYFWCSVNDGGTTTLNPSLVLHVPPESQCSKDNKKCAQNIYLHSTYSTSATRCADQEISVNVIEAQSCSQNPEEVRTVTANSQVNEHTKTPKKKHTTATTTSAPPTASLTLALNMYIVIGGSLGGLIVIIIPFCIIGLLISCMIKRKINRHRREHTRATDECSPFDDIRMNTSTKQFEDEQVRISKLVCESNFCYDECPRVPVSQSIENIYESIR